MDGEVHEGDRCPECREGVIVIKYPEFYMECDNCGARWNDRGQRVACGDAPAT